MTLSQVKPSRLQARVIEKCTSSSLRMAVSNSISNNFYYCFVWEDTSKFCVESFSHSNHDYD